MYYIIHNITHTSDDQHRRGHRVREFRKGRVQIGPRNILEGRSASFSEDMYETYRARVDHYLAIGMIKVVQMGVPADSGDPELRVEPVVEHTPHDIEAEPDPLDVVHVPAAVEEVATEEPVGETAPDLEEGEVLEAAQAPKRRSRPPKEK